MRAAISDEWLDMINEKIYLGLEIHVLNKRLISSGNINQKQLETVIKMKNNELKQVNSFLNKHKIKVGEVEKLDSMFVQYYYSIKVDGGYKEGYQKYWRDAMKLNLKKRLSKHFNVR
jgi:hypothetical protein